MQKIFILSFLLTLSLSISITSLASSNSELWPTSKWSYHKKNLSEYSKELNTYSKRKYSVLVIKDGKILFEKYQAPYLRESLIHVNSCTKSVISILFGMISRDSSKNLNENQPVYSHFPEFNLKNDRFKEIRIEHFLSMSSGLSWNGGIDAKDVIKMSNSRDWTQYVFQRSVIHPVGEVFNYNSGGTQLVARLLQKKVKGSLKKYAEKKLFGPLGISHFRWDVNQKKILKAGWGLHLKMHDMAKLGYLMLKKGKWNQKRIVPERWVNESTTIKIAASEKFDYGYQFWIPKYLNSSAYYFRGSYPPSKKIIAVFPKLNAVVVYVGEEKNTKKLFNRILIPMIQNQ